MKCQSPAEFRRSNAEDAAAVSQRMVTVKAGVLMVRGSRQETRRWAQPPQKQKPKQKQDATKTTAFRDKKSFRQSVCQVARVPQALKAKLSRQLVTIQVVAMTETLEQEQQGEDQQEQSYRMISDKEANETELTFAVHTPCSQGQNAARALMEAANLTNNCLKIESTNTNQRQKEMAALDCRE